MWTTDAGIKRFFAPASHVEARVGGPYTIIFDPAHDPNGDAAGTNGSKVLRVEAPKLFVAEWDCGVPDISPSLKKITNPSTIELRFEPVDATHTRVKITHAGFRTDGEWPKAYAFFKDAAWPKVMRDFQSATARRP